MNPMIRKELRQRMRERRGWLLPSLYLIVLGAAVTFAYFVTTAERGRSMFDARHRFVLSYQWSLPFLQHSGSWYGHVLGNWQLNGIVTAMSGTPFTVFDSNDVSLQGQAPEISGFSSNRPNVIGNPNSGPHTTAQWFNVNAFQRIAQDPNSPVQQFGNEGRNAVQGPGYVNWDFSAFKFFHTSEKTDLEFRAEFFNLPNHTNFLFANSGPQNGNNATILGTQQFGNLTAARPPRQIQFALKFSF